MISNIVGNYLIGKGIINQEQMTELFEEMKKVRVKLGLIAVAEGMMTQEQADRVNRLQAVMDKRFGDIAVSKGYLTDGQVEELLKKQGNPYMALAQAMENLGIMNVSQLDEHMREYQKENELSNSSMEDLKSDDIDRVLPLLLPAEATGFLNMAGIALRTIMRCVDNDVLPMKARFETSLDADNGAMQYVDGEVPVTVAIAGIGQSLLPTASYFGKEEFEKVDMDALDAIGELINCINGLYASALSQQRIEMELCPPEFSDEISGFSGEEMLVFPMKVRGETIHFVMSINKKIEMH